MFWDVALWTPLRRWSSRRGVHRIHFWWTCANTNVIFVVWTADWHFGKSAVVILQCSFVCRGWYIGSAAKRLIRCGAIETSFVLSACSRSRLERILRTSQQNVWMNNQLDWIKDNYRWPGTSARLGQWVGVRSWMLLSPWRTAYGRIAQCTRLHVEMWPRIES